MTGSMSEVVVLVWRHVIVKAGMLAIDAVKLC